MGTEDQESNHEYLERLFYKMSHLPRILIFSTLFSLPFCGLHAAETVSVDQARKSVEKPADAPESTWKPPVATAKKAPLPIDEKQVKKIIDEVGIEIHSLQITAGGYMMDFRFRVLDADKARIFFDHRIKPYLHVEKSNAKLPVPMAEKVGAFRTTDRGKNIKPNKNYYIVFANPDAHVKRGEKVTMVFGDFKIEDMTVN